MSLEDCPHRHRFRFVGRYLGDGDGVTEPARGDLLWKSDRHEPTSTGVIWHAYAMSPEKFWTTAK